MHKNKTLHPQKGFTIVELLVVIVVIGILAALVVSTFASLQVKARETERVTDTKALQKKLEEYKASKGTYPLTNQMTDDAWTVPNLSNDSAMYTGPGGTPTLAVRSALAGLTVAEYSYRGCTSSQMNPTDCQCTTANGNVEADCVKYFVCYRSEVDGLRKDVRSLTGW